MLDAKELGSLYQELMEKYPIVLLEDPFAQDDWAAWSTFNQSTQVELVGDDLLATNIERIKIAEERKACNGLLLKINQIGTITESIKAYVLSRFSLSAPTLTSVQGAAGIHVRLERFRVAPIWRDTG